MTAAESYLTKKTRNVMEEIREDAQPLTQKDATIPAPACLDAMVGQICKFQVKVSMFTFGAMWKTVTVSRIIEDEVIKTGAPEEKTRQSNNEEDVPATENDTSDMETSHTTSDTKKDGKRPHIN